MSMGRSNEGFGCGDARRIILRIKWEVRKVSDRIGTAIEPTEALRMSWAGQLHETGSAELLERVKGIEPSS